jgi:hypothetical protein
MKPILLAVLLATTFFITLFPRQTAGAEVTLILRNIATDDFEEWKIKGGHHFTQSTGKLGRETSEFEQTWDVGKAGGEIRFWWSRLRGEADATVLVNNVVVFQGHCLHAGNGSVRMIDSCSYPRVYKVDGGGPYLVDKLTCNSTRVLFATSMLPERFHQP